MHIFLSIQNFIHAVALLIFIVIYSKFLYSTNVRSVFFFSFWNSLSFCSEVPQEIYYNYYDMNTVRTPLLEGKY